MKQHGMTLLELLVALMFFSLAAIAILDTIGTTGREVTDIEHKTIAHWVATNHLEEKRERSDWQNIGVERAQTEMAGRTWYVAMSVQATARPDIRRLSVTVSDDPDGGVISSRDWFFGRVK